MNSTLKDFEFRKRSFIRAASLSVPFLPQPQNLAGVGQLIIGGIETIGGILTGDPTTRAEGDLN